MKKILKILFVLILGIIAGYYFSNKKIFNVFDQSYKAFQVGVYTDISIANTYKTKYENAIVVKDNELYRVYVAILKDNKNIEDMCSYLNRNNIEYYIRNVEIKDKNLKNKIKEYESIMNSDSQIVFLEVNKMIMESYEESLWN